MRLQNPSNLARLVRNARTQLGLTQQDVADAVGITRQSLARLERGNCGISVGTVIVILDHLGIQLEAIPIAPTAAMPSPVTVTNEARAAAVALFDSERGATSRLVIPGGVTLKTPYAVETAVEYVADDDKAVGAE